MNRVGIDAGYFANNRNAGKTTRREVDKSYRTAGFTGMENADRIQHRAGYNANILLELYEQGCVKSMNGIRRNVLLKEDVAKKEEAEQESMSGKESDVDTEVIVRPDGSRVLMMTVNIGGMSTTMSMKISEPAEAVNEVSRVEQDGEETKCAGMQEDFVKADDIADGITEGVFETEK